jgi:hypothetical protein
MLLATHFERVERPTIAALLKAGAKLDRQRDLWVFPDASCGRFVEQGFARPRFVVVTEFKL